MHRNRKRFSIYLTKKNLLGKMKTVFKLKERIMSRKNTYKTKQMVQLVEYLKNMEGHHVMVSDICEYFEKNGISVGMTTIYRNLEKLVEQGVVAKFVVDQANGACFEYLGEHEPEEHCSCYHCKCDQCGKIIHLACHEVEELGEHFLKHHGFLLNYQKIVFYGLCKECRENSLV